MHPIVQNRQNMRGPKRQIILVDLDMTLIGRDYRPSTRSTERLRTLVKGLQKRGVMIGLNSDSPVETLRRWAAVFGLRGPVVAEMGQVVDRGKAQELSVLGDWARLTESIRLRVMSRLLREGKHVFAGHGDAQAYVEGGGKAYGDDHNVYLISRLRRCSLLVYGLRLQGRRLMPNRSGMKLATEIISSELSEAGIDSFSIQEDYSSGIVIAHDLCASKSRGFIEIMEQNRPGAGYIMVGNGKSDIITGTSIPVVHCAVGNAVPELKRAAIETDGIVARSVLTEGVIEILTILSRNLG